ncbi:MAG: hypothetical protein ACOZQL_07060 [Myxococcota bacterium]
MNRTWIVIAVMVLGGACGSMPSEDELSQGDGGRAGGGAGGGGGRATGGGTATGGGGDTATGGGNATGGGGGTECTTGTTRACCGTGSQTCTTFGVWGGCSLTGTAEVCNGVDDDCDGEVDEDVAFTAGELADAGAQLDGGCAVGVGACQRIGAVVCAAAGPTCGASAGAPGTETCNRVDDDCDGEVDEGLLVSCLPDQDGDGYATDRTTLTMECPDLSRSAFGSCPMGFVAPSASRGLDCDGNDATKFALRTVRTDADADGACVRPPLEVCGGTTPGAGQRDPAQCAATDDCDDNDSMAFRLAAVRTDRDGDRACLGTGRTLCIGAAAPAGSTLSNECRATDDCNDASTAAFQLLTVRVDADGDRACASTAAVSQCTGTTPLPGYRLASECNAENDCDETTNTKYRLVNLYADADGDQHCLSTPTPACVGPVAIAPGFLSVDLCLDLTECNDNDSGTWRVVGMRRDQDNDGYCADTSTTNLCVGTSAPSGYRFTCPPTLDCRDSNPNATTACSTTVTSNQQTKYCSTSTPATETFTFNFQCPVGFYATNASAVRRYSNCVDGSCTIANAFSFTGITSQAASFTCEFAAIGHDDWVLNVSCSAF